MVIFAYALLISPIRAIYTPLIPSHICHNEKAISLALNIVSGAASQIIPNSVCKIEVTHSLNHREIQFILMIKKGLLSSTNDIDEETRGKKKNKLKDERSFFTFESIADNFL